MAKVTKLKTMLKKMLETFASISTDKGLLSYDSEGQLPEVGESIYLVDEEGNETPAADGEYTTEDGTVIVIADGKVEEIREPAKEDPVEEEAEPVEVEAEDVTVIEPAEPAPVNEEVVIEEPQEDPVEARFAALEARIAALEARIAALEAEPAVETADEQFRRVNQYKKTNDKKMDRLMEIVNSK